MRRAAAAAAALVAVASAAGAGAAVPAHAASTICVAVVVDSRPLQGPVSTGCASVAAGSTGYDVLYKTGHRLTFRPSDGLLCTIDGRPGSGCAATDGSHYWSYWHRPPGGSSWEYSDQGGGSYHPADKSTEGWVWQDGGSTGSTRPENVAYGSICRPTASPAPTPTRTTAPVARATTGARRVAAAPTTAPTRTTTATASPTRSARAATRAAPAPTPSASGSLAPDSTAGTDPAPPTRASSSSGGGPPVGGLVGLAVVAAVAVGAALRFRRGREGGG